MSNDIDEPIEDWLGAHAEKPQASLPTAYCQLPADFKVTTAVGTTSSHSEQSR